MSVKEKRLPRWYFGGLASAGAACCTHPLDLLKVQLQTQQEGKVTLGQLTVNIVRKHGVLALYNGLSASLLRQLTYSTTRFAIYEMAKQYLAKGGKGESNFGTKVLIAGLAGAAGGFVGTPADLVNVRMQNDMKLAAEKRRNYKHALDGLYRVCKEEGLLKLFNGASAATSRAILMTIGQLSFYDQIKSTLLKFKFQDNPGTHFLSSLLAGVVCATLVQPLDVCKTRMMNAKVGEPSSLPQIMVQVAKEGPLAFYKGYIPSTVRILPMNVLVLMFYEQMRQNFGYLPPEKHE